MNGTTPDVLSLPKGGGAVGGLGGAFTPDLNTGGGGYAVPLDLPQGVDGHTPKLTLQYATGFGDGPFGFGWSLPVLRIELSCDGRLPRYDGKDPLVLPGAGPLVEVPGDAGQLVPETDGLGWRIRRQGDGFELTDRSGTRHLVGTTATARIADPADPGRVFAWLLERSIRPSGDEIVHTWTADGLPESVSWARYRLQMHYESRPDPIFDGRSGFPLTTTRRCTSIELHAPAQAPSLLRRYTLDYAAGRPTGHSLLAGVTLSGHTADGGTATFPRLAFGYTTGGGFAVQAVSPDVARVLAAPQGTVADLSGDGLPDAVALGPTPTVTRNRGGLAFAPPRRLARTGLPGAPPGATVFAADLSGRGRVDLVAVGRGLRHRYPMDGTGVVGAPVVSAYAPTFTPWDSDVRLLDLDGDGAADLFRLADGVLATVSTAGGAEDWRRVERRRIGSTDPLSDVDLRSPDIHVAPMTGDGLAALVEVRSGRVRYWPNLGNGRWGPARTMADSPVLPAGYRTDRLLLTDVDGDGCADLVYVDTTAVRIWPNLGGAAFGSEITVAPVPGFAAERVEPVDLRGTGCVGLLLTTRHRTRPTACMVDLNAKPYLLNRIDDGLGHVTEIDYGTSPAEARRDAERGQPWSTSLPFCLPVVTRLTQTAPAAAPRVSRFSYHNGHWDPALRRFLGFARVDEVEEGDDTVEALLKRTEFHLGRTPERTDRPPTTAERLVAQVLRGRVIRSAGYPAGSDPDTQPPLFEVRQTWQAHLADVGGVTVASPRLTERREDHLDGAAIAWRTTVTTTLGWDDFGNITEQVQRNTLASDPAATQELRTATAYATNPDGWLVDRPARVTQTDGTGTVVDARVLRYDGEPFTGLPEGSVTLGHVTSEERLVLRDDQVIAVYGGDPPDLAELGYHRRTDEGGWWVYVRRYDRSTPGTLVSRDPRGTPVTLGLDTDRLFPVRRTDARGNVVEATVDHYALRPATLTDGNGGLRRNSYDALARPVAEFRPGDESDAPTVVYRYLLDPAGAAVETVEYPRADRGDTVTSRRLVDSDGRETGVARLDGDGSWLVTDAVWRNSRGLVARQYLPYRTPVGSDPQLPTQARAHLATRYDALGRPLRVDLPDGAFRLGTHAPGRSDLWDEEDTRAGGAHEDTPTSYHLDAAGRVGRVVSRSGTTEVVTRYRYDLRDQPVEITDANGRVTAVTYDLMGRRIRVDDPATGTVLFVHDAAGNLVDRRNAVGQHAGYRFDELNRMVRSTQDGQPDVVYHYLDQADVVDGVAPGRRIGRLASVDDVRGTLTFDYDVRGEVELRRVKLTDGTVHALRRRTDRLGRVCSIEYPGATPDTPGPVLTYRYGPRGLLSAIPGVVDSIDYDPAGRPVRTVYTGGVRTTQRYDVLSRLIASEVTDAAGRLLDQETLTRDRAGHVLTVSGATPADTWTYSHDDLYQLTRAQPASGPTLDFAYDPAGNILSRTDVGTFLYGERGAPPVCVTTAGSQQYDYDAAGRQTSSRAGTLSYDGRDRLVEITGAVGAQVSYGAFDERAVREIKTAGRTLRTVLLDELVELHDGQLLCIVTDGRSRIGQFVPGRSLTRWHTDHRGSVRLMTTGMGTVVQRIAYDPFGRILSLQPGDRPRDTYDGYELLEEVSLYLSPKRPYDPVLGRYLVPDTVATDLWQPVGLNRYAYAANDPVTLRDPTGRAWWQIALAIVAVVAVVVLTVVTFGAGLITLGAMIGVFAAMAVGGAVGGIAAAQAGGDIVLGILLGAALAGAAALGGALAGAGFAAALGAKSLATFLLSGAVSGALLGASTGFAAGFAGGTGSLGQIWEKTWQSALAGFVTGLVFGAASYGFAQGWFGTGNIDPRFPTGAETRRALAEGAKAAGQAANTGAGASTAIGQGAASAATSLAGTALNFGAPTGFNVLQTFVFNPVAGTLLIESVAVLFAFDLVDDVIDLLKEKSAKISVSGTF
ncbi:toxin TcdB middle/N-terminal domain-containing protein [Streptomyces sp. NPDC047869]|uniref:toxin TcdB middle/N-terminal domain-containing protein n=1 Tax=Streptomyces sp. NPDC047869 TaxID=3154709 RepID=UPI003454E684